MTSYRWDRPKLPEDNRPFSINLGWALIVLGAMATAYYAFGNSRDPAVAFLALYGGGLTTSAGILLACLGLILKELRQSAFEAALRSGDVETES